MRAAATGNTRSPTVEQRVMAGTISCDVAADRRCRGENNSQHKSVNMLFTGSWVVICCGLSASSSVDVVII